MVIIGQKGGVRRPKNRQIGEFYTTVSAKTLDCAPLHRTLAESSVLAFGLMSHNSHYATKQATKF